MANIKFAEKEKLMQICAELVNRIEDKELYYNTQIAEYQGMREDDMTSWDLVQYNDAKIYVSACDKIITHLEKLI